MRNPTPYFLPEAHEVRVGDFRDVDWTLRPNDWDAEMRLRTKRNKLIMDQLKAGKSVAYRSSGWSLWPRVHPNDLCVY